MSCPVTSTVITPARQRYLQLPTNPRRLHRDQAHKTSRFPPSPRHSPQPLGARIGQLFHHGGLHTPTTSSGEPHSVQRATEVSHHLPAVPLHSVSVAALDRTVALITTVAILFALGRPPTKAEEPQVHQVQVSPWCGRLNLPLYLLRICRFSSR